MTEKRFTIAIDSNNLKSLWDNERTEEEPLLWLTRSDRIGGIDNVCKLLNELYEENEQLRNDCSILVQSNQEYRKENEQLKQYIYDNLDEDICDVCSYQYLEKSQMDKYYVAKCKKGWDNCSKGTVIHCKDFKFKELQE